jgi:predicted ATPase/class 3 adenylate cyclase
LADLPSGTVTFLFTDIEGSTALWERDQVAMATAVAQHLNLLRHAVEAHGGVLFKTIGDAVQAAFPTAPGAIAAAVAAQWALQAEQWPDPPGPLRVRMALHAGEAEPDVRGDYLSAPLNRLSRLLSAGHGCQILLSQAVQQLTRDTLPSGASLQDLGEHRLRDLLEPERIWQVLAPGLEHDFPPLETLERRPNNLPRQPTLFLGREREVQTVVTLLRRDDVQLVTLTGPAGMGKTRLALQAAIELLDAFPDGVFFVDLASLTDPDLVAASLSAVLGLRQEGDRSPGEVVAGFLRDKQVLLLLDNFEHVLDGAAIVSELLRACPGLKVLATSRAPLRLRAERDVSVPPLGLPDPTRPQPLERLVQYDAVRLFLERAVAAKPDFTLDVSNATAVAEICLQLDGLPLAIELAAARVRMLPPQALLTRLEQRLSLLTTGARDAPERQRTLRNAIAWSYDLLSAPEQTVFRRLGVFVGGCTLEAAEAVAGADSEVDVFSCLTALIDESLLRQEEGPEGELRFRMLETIREFAHEQLVKSGEEDEIRARHAAWLLARAHETWPVHVARYTIDLVERLNVEYANLMAALEWLARTDQGELLVKLAAPMGNLWYLTARYREGQMWLERALTAGPEAPTRDWAMALLHAGRLAQSLGENTTALARLEESQGLLHRLGLSVEEGEAILVQGIVDEDRGKYDAAEPRFVTARELLRKGGDETGVAVATYHLGTVAYGRGEADRARELWEAAVADLRARGDLVPVTWCLGYLALLAAEQGEVQQSADILRESMLLAQKIVLRHHQGMVLRVTAVLGGACGMETVAAHLQGAADALDDGGPVELPEGLAFEQAAQHLRAVLGEAEYTRAWREGQAFRPEDVEAALAMILEAASAAAPAPVPLDLQHS